MSISSPFCVVEFVLQKGKFLAWDDFDSKSILQLPLPFQGHDALVDVGGHIGMDVEFEFLYA